MISDLNGEPIFGSFYEKELQKTNQEKFRIEKALKRKGDKLSNGKGVIIHLIVGLIKKVNTFLNHLKVLEEILTLKLIFLITQQKLILKM